MPCYNHGIYIHDAVNSLEQVSNKNLYELIIINDGSTDPYTIEQLDNLSNKGFNVIHQQNQGLSTARNNAIRSSKGKYIFPLDSDNMARSRYIEVALDIMENDEQISVVYGNAMFFGDASREYRPGPFNMQKLMLGNYIDACAIYRKDMWEKIGGYDKAMKYGHEDWEFWLNAAFSGYRFQYVDEVLYDYRFLDNSMARQLNKYKIQNTYNTDYLQKKHPQYYGPQYIDADILKKFGTSPVGFIGKIILKKYFPKVFDKYVSQGKLRKHI